MNKSSQEMEESMNERQKGGKKQKESYWRVFERFLAEPSNNVSFHPATSNRQEICRVMKKFAFNMKKENEDSYCDSSMKTIWNSVAKQINEKFFQEQQQTINIFEDPAFKAARAARDTARSLIQKIPEKRKVSASAVTAEEAIAMVNVWGIDTPQGLNMTLFIIAGLCLGC